MQVKTVESLQRLRNDRDGNPRWEVTFTDGVVAKTARGAQVNYGIDNAEHRGVPLEVEFTSSGTIRAVRIRSTQASLSMDLAPRCEYADEASDGDCFLIPVARFGQADLCADHARSSGYAVED